MPGAFAACVAAGLSVYSNDESRSACFYNAGYCWRYCWMEFVYWIFGHKYSEFLLPILGTWVLCPVIAGVIAMGFFTITKKVIS